MFEGFLQERIKDDYLLLRLGSLPFPQIVSFFSPESLFMCITAFTADFMLILFICQAIRVYLIELRFNRNIRAIGCTEFCRLICARERFSVGSCWEIYLCCERFRGFLGKLNFCPGHQRNMLSIKIVIKWL